jgi:hypothetical protein
MHALANPLLQAHALVRQRIRWCHSNELEPDRMRIGFDLLG